MDYTYDQLKKMTVAELRDVAKEIDSEHVQGYTQLNKGPLIEAICKAQGIEAQEEKEVVGGDKASLKKKIRKLKKERDAALKAKDKKELKKVRRQIHRLKLRLRRVVS